MIRARKRFGQHFLHDPGVISRIVAAIDPQPGERVVEIGPGLGALSRPLLQRCGRLEAIEIDRDVIPELQRHCAGAGELVVLQGDVLRMDIAALYGDGPPLRLCGNLPYNISTPLLFHLLESRAAIADMHFMLQKEVVDRMVAGPGGKIYGRLTVMLANSFDPDVTGDYQLKVTAVAGAVSARQAGYTKPGKAPWSKIGMRVKGRG
jgi:16S rRNA (adenine1518-N6/adenine1519-N6)-dimethyltransferase